MEMSVRKGVRNAKILDYVVGWFFKASRLSGSQLSRRCALCPQTRFVKGDRCHCFGPILLKAEHEIIFAHHARFKWANNASEQCRRNRV